MPIFVGVDVARQTHWVCAVDQDTRILIDRAVANDQPSLDAPGAEPGALGPGLTVALAGAPWSAIGPRTRASGSIASLLEAVLLAEGLALVHVPGIAVNRAGQGFAGGERKSDPKDARTIAELARTRPDLRPVALDDETTVAIRLKVARRRDLVTDQTRRLSRLRQLLGAIHPGLERTLDVTTKGPLALLTRYVAPGEIRKAGHRRILARLRKVPQLRDAEALDARARIARLDREPEALLRDHPDGALIQSLPGMGAILAAEFVAAAGDLARCRSADAMAAAAGLAPVLRQSGRSRALRRAFGGDRALKRVFFQSAFCAVTTRDPASTAFCARKRSERKRHNQAIIALARRRVTVLWTMLRNRTAFEPDRHAA
jgi:transposase